MILNPRLIIPESFEACLTYEQQITFLAKWCGELADKIGGSGSPEIEDLKQRVSALEAEDANISAQIEEISAQLQTLQKSLNGKQDELTFDSTPTSGSTNPVTSGGIKAYVDKAVAGGGGTITIDPTPTKNSPNAVQSGGTYNAIQAVRTTAEAAQSAASAASSAAASATETAKSASSAAEQAQTVAETAQETANTAQQAATAAQTAADTAQETAEAANTAAGNAASAAASAAETAGAAQTAATQAQQTASAASTAAGEAQETASAAASAAATAQSAAAQAQQTADAKQDELTFDSTPTAGSANPVTSGGIKTYVDNAVSGGGGGGGETSGPLRGVRAGDLTYYVDSDGWVQQMDYNHDCYLFRSAASGNATLILDGATWDSGMSVSHYASVLMPLSVDGKPIIITGGSNSANGIIGINNGTPAWAAAPMNTSPYLFGTILRVPVPRLVSFGATQAQYRGFYAEVQEDNKLHIGFRDPETVSLPNTYTIYASNGFTVYAYRSGFVDVLDPGTFTVIQSVAIPAGQTPVHLAHIGTHIYLMCEGACYKARSGIVKLGTFEQVFTSTYPTSGATSTGNYGAGPDWVSLNENGGYSLVTEEALTYNVMKAMVQGMTAYYNTADEAGHVETPDGVTLPIGKTGYTTSVMFPALRFI